MPDVDGEVEVGGARLAYRERGEGEPVLLLHPGFVADGMLPLLNAVELTGFRVIGYHRRGYGASPRTAVAPDPGCEGAEVPPASHLLQIADPRPVAHRIADFLRRHPLPG